MVLILVDLSTIATLATSDIINLLIYIPHDQAVYHCHPLERVWISCCCVEVHFFVDVFCLPLPWLCLIEKKKEAGWITGTRKFHRLHANTLPL